jgi:hypothetical protein
MCAGPLNVESAIHILALCVWSFKYQVTNLPLSSNAKDAAHDWL